MYKYIVYLIVQIIVTTNYCISFMLSSFFFFGRGMSLILSTVECTCAMYRKKYSVVKTYAPFLSSQCSKDFRFYSKIALSVFRF